MSTPPVRKSPTVINVESQSLKGISDLQKTKTFRNPQEFYDALKGCDVEEKIEKPPADIAEKKA